MHLKLRSKDSVVLVTRLGTYAGIHSLPFVIKTLLSVLITKYLFKKIRQKRQNLLEVSRQHWQALSSYINTLLWSSSQLSECVLSLVILQTIIFDHITFTIIIDYIIFTIIIDYIIFTIIIDYIIFTIISTT